MSERKSILNKKRIVIKVGSSTLTHPNGSLNLSRIEKLAGVITYLHNQGKEVVLVSSGAIAAGVGKIGLDKKPADKIKKQALAAIGQAELIKIYEKFFEEYNKTVAQLLLTRDGIENASRRRNARNTFKELLSMKVIPIVNENDTVSTDEIEFGDNDILSAMVSSLINADLLIILSDIDGVYTSDPNIDKNARLISDLSKEDGDISKFIFDSESAFGSGGMASKLTAGKHCVENGIDMVIANGANPSIIYTVLEGKEVGTYFKGSE
ncbi:MAG: glutamate 5-kinase [Bacteroidales bacterium]|nr:glutamate 5-kinase [Bacteroidales bacterium]MCF8390967.1 glutamate 5-kinase [Bacteroidales bacterium]